METPSPSGQMPATMTPGARRVLEFTQHSYLAILATVYPSGGPQAFPVYYRYDGDIFTITTPAETAKVRNIDQNPQVALCITDTTRHVRSLTVRGRAEVIRDDAAAHRLHRQLAIQFLGLEEGEAWDDSMADEEMAIIRVIPERFLWTG